MNRKNFFPFGEDFYPFFFKNKNFYCCSIGYLIKEILLDVDREINKVGSNEWFEGSVSVIENVRLTLEDYFRDYEYLKDGNSDALKIHLQKSLAKSYISAIFSKYRFYS